MQEILFPALTSLLALGFVGYLAVDLLRKNPGSPKMVQISRAVQEGAQAFLRREYRYVAVFVLVIAAVFAAVPLFSQVNLSWRTSIAFMTGGVVSALAGYIGMSIASSS